MDLNAAIDNASKAYSVQAESRGLLGLDGDKKQAVQAIKLGEQTGSDPNTIYGDVDGFTKQYKGELTSEIIRRDPKTVEFLNKYRMGAIAAQDDWHNISGFNQKLDAFGVGLIPGAKMIPDIVHGIVSHLDPSAIGKWLNAPAEGGDPNVPAVGKHVWDGPWGALSYASWYALGGAVILGAQGVSGALEGFKVGTTELFKSLGASDSQAQRAAREFTAMAEWGLTGQAGFRGQFRPGEMTTKGAIREATKRADQEIAGKQARGEGPTITVKAGGVTSTGPVDPAIARFNEAIDRAAPYIKAGEDPPIGLHPLWDEALAARKQGSMKAYDELIEATRKSELRTETPDYFSKLVDGHDKGSMHVDADAVLKLYGDKIPEPGDGLLGDVPGIAKAFEDAKKGVDVEVPWSHWLAKVPDEVADGLREDLRWHPGDYTLREADAVPPAKDVLGPIEEAKPSEIPVLPDVPTGHTRFYHGGRDPASGGGRWVTPDYKYARDYREGEPVSWVDIPNDHPQLRKSFEDAGTDQIAPYVSFEAPPEIAARLKPVEPAKELTAEEAKIAEYDAAWKHLETEFKRPKPGDPNFTVAEFNEQWKAFEREWERPAEEKVAPSEVHVEQPKERADRLRAEYAERTKTHAEEVGKKETLTDTLEQVAGEKITPEGLTRAVRYGMLNSRPDLVTRALEIADRVNLRLATKLRADIQSMQNRLNVLLSVKQEMAARPMFPIEDRPIEVRLQRPTKPRLTPDALKGEHSFDIIDENGASVGSLEVTPREGGKDIHIDWIGGLIKSHEAAKPTEGMLGPKHLRTLLDDLVREFPDAEKISGVKVIGEGVEEVSVNLKKLREEGAKPAWEYSDPSKDWRDFEQLVASGEGWEHFGAGVVIKPVGEMLKHEAGLIEDINALIARIAGGGIEVQPAHEIRFGKAGEQARPAEAMYITYGQTNPLISFVLSSMDPFGFTRHETVHHLKTYDFYRPNEWKVLRAESMKRWVKEHDIVKRYPELKDKPVSIIEEGVAEAFRKWGANRETASEVGKIFQKMLDFFVNLKANIKERFGYDLTPDEIFTRMETGVMRERGPGKPEGLFEISAARPEAPGFELPPIEEAGPTWMSGVLKDKAGMARYMRLINKINSKDVKKLYWDAFQEERKRQIPEWDRAAAEIYSKIYDDVSKRPDFRTSDFLRNGKLGDVVVPPNSRKIDPKWLTPEQKAKFPKAFLSKGGNKPDEMAGPMGYKTGVEMIEDIIRFEEAKAGDKPGLFKDKIVAQEVESQMRERFGDLDENIIKAAREHAIGMERFDLIHEEYLKLAIMNKQQLPLTKQDFRNNALKGFVDTPYTKTELINYTRRIGKLARTAEDAWLKGDVVEALRVKQLQVMAEAEAELAKKFEKVKNQWKAGLKRTEPREPSGIMMEHVNWIHDIRDRVGAGTKQRDRADIDINIERQNIKTLREFSERHAAEGLPEGYELIELEQDSAIPIWEPLKDPKFTFDIKGATVGEFTAINNSIQALIKHGREEKTAVIAGERASRRSLIDRMVEQMDEVREDKIYTPAGGKFRGRALAKSWGRTISAGLLQMEYLWDRLDKATHGLFTKTIGVPFAKAGNEYRLLHRDFAKKLNAIGKKYKGDLEEAIPNNHFREPMSVWKEVEEGGEKTLKPSEFMDMTRRALRGVMLNIGNASNLDKLARGYGTTAEAVMKWVHDYAKPDDWAFAREVGQIYKELGEMEDTLNMNLTGVTVHKIPLDDIMMPDGTTVPGWYYPMIYDKSKGGGKPPHIDINVPPVMRIMTDHGFERPRTNYAGPVSLDISQIPDHIGRRLRNVAFREIITEQKKILLDPQFQAALSRNMGPEFAALMEPYLRDVAGVRGIPSQNYARLNSFFEAARINIVGLMIGWNPGTVMKHTPTAYGQSFKELNNPAHLLEASKDLWTQNSPQQGKSWTEWMMEGGKVGDLDWKGSGELQGRLQHWQETLSGVAEIIDWDLSTLKRARLTALQTGAWMIAKSDLWASKTLFLAKYREVFDELGHLPIEQAHTQAVDMAEKAIRKTHGSTAVTSKPEFMRNPDAIVRTMTSLYQFFNHIANRFWEMGWKSKEIKRKMEAGEPTAKDISDVVSSFMLYVVFPALIEETVTPMFDKEGRSWASRFALSTLHPVFAAVPIVREVYHATISGHDPAFGMAASGMKTFTDLARSVRRGDPFDKYNFGNTLAGVIALSGMAGGLASAQQARWAKFAWNYFIAGTEQPTTKEEWYRAFRYGRSRQRRH